MQLLLYGRGAASSTYPCLWCWVRGKDLLQSITTRVDEFDLPFERMPTVKEMADKYAERVERNYMDDSDDARFFNQKHAPLIDIDPWRCPPEKLHLQLRPVDKFDEIHEVLPKERKISDTDYQRLLRRLHVFKASERGVGGCASSATGASLHQVHGSGPQPALVHGGAHHRGRRRRRRRCRRHPRPCSSSSF